jgi:hypothetical protein
LSIYVALLTFVFDVNCVVNLIFTQM